MEALVRYRDMPMMSLSWMWVLTVALAPAGSGAASPRCAEAPERIAGLVNVSAAQGERLAQHARESGMGIVMRPTGAGAAERRADDHSPKPEAIKWKTCNDRDILLGAPAGCQAALVLFEPHLPNPLPADFHQRKLLHERYAQRAEEWKNALKDKAVLWSDDGTVLIFRDKACRNMPSPTPEGCIVGYRSPDGYVNDVRNGRPFTGDLDLFDITSGQGRALPSALEAKRDLVNALIADPKIDVLHGVHMDWDTSKVDEEDRAKAEDIRQLILDIHRARPTRTARNEALVLVKPDCSVCKTFSAPVGKEEGWVYKCAADLKYAAGKSLYIKSTPTAHEDTCFAITITRAARHDDGTASYEFKNTGGGVSGDDSVALEGRVCKGAPAKPQNVRLPVGMHLRIKGGPDAPDSDCFAVTITRSIAYDDGTGAYEYKNAGGGVSGDDADALEARICGS